MTKQYYNELKFDINIDLGENALLQFLKLFVEFDLLRVDWLFKVKK